MLVTIFTYIFSSKSYFSSSKSYFVFLMFPTLTLYPYVVSLCSPTPSPLSQSTLLNLCAQCDDLDTCVALVDLFLARCVDSEAHTRLKALRSLKFLCQKARQEFRIQVQRKNQPIKECVSYRGTQDPLRGDTVNQAVRDAAKELMEVMFQSWDGHVQRVAVSGRSAEPDSFTTNAQSYTNVVQQSGKMQGFANPSFEPQLEESSFFASKIADSVVSLFTGREREDSNLLDKGSYQHPDSTIQGSYQPAKTGTVSFNMQPSNFGSANAGFSQRQPGTVGGAWANENQRFTKSSENSGDKESLPFHSLSNFVVEQRFIDDFTFPSGVKAQPSADQILKFTRNLMSFNTGALVAMLLLKFASTVVWNSQFKALCGLEVLINSEKGNEVKSLLLENRSTPQVAALFNLSTSTNATVKTKASKIIQDAGLADKSMPKEIKSNDFFPSDVISVNNAAAAVQTQPASQAAVKQSDSVNFLDLAVAPVQSNSFGFIGDNNTGEVQNHSAPLADTVDMFGNLSIRKQSANDLLNFSFVSLQPAAQSNSVDMFAGMTATVPVDQNKRGVDPFDFIESSVNETGDSGGNGFDLNFASVKNNPVPAQINTNDITNLYKTPYGNAPSFAQTNPYTARQPAYGQPAYGQGSYTQPAFNPYAARPPAFNANVGALRNDPLQALAQGSSVPKPQRGKDLNDHFSFVTLK